MTDPPIHPPEQLSARTAVSRGQLLMWMGQRLSPEAPLYNMVLTFEIDGDLDVEAFRQSFSLLIESSDALGSCFEEVDGAPVRKRQEAPAELDWMDASAEPDPRAWLARWAKERSMRRIPLETRPYDAALVRLGEMSHAWYFAQHHIVSDAWSTTVCFERVSGFYAALTAGESPSASGFPAYERYVEHERRASESAALERARRHWTATAELPYERTGFYGGVAGTGSGRTERVECRLGPERSARLRDLANRPGFGALTPGLSRFHLLATALFALLRRVGGEREDLAILAPVHNRSTPDFKRTVGLFVEVLPLHVRVEAEDTFASLHDRVARAYREFLAHALPGSSSADRTKSYDVLLNTIPSTFGGEFAGLPARSNWVHPDHGDPAHALRLQVHDFDASDDLLLQFDLSPEAFGPAERSAVPRHFLALLDAFVADPERPVADVDLVTEEERCALVEGLTGVERTWPHATVVQAFEDQSARTPDAPALRAGDRVLSYRDLVRATDRLADELRANGAGRGSLVAVQLDRSPEYVVALLAALRAGAAYLPIEPSLPEGRVAVLLEDSGADCRIASTELTVERLRSNGNGAPHAAPGPDDLAYVIYTSGSTGRPKGVEVTHGALAHYAQWAREQYAPDRSADMPLVSPVSVDLTLTSIWVPLLSGGAIEVYPPSDEGPDLAVLDVLRDDRVDVLKLTPAHLSMLLGAGDLSSDRLRALVVGGDDLRGRLAQRVSDALGDRVAIYNEYGPTEATVGCMVHRFDPALDVGASVPIGRPIANARVLVLDGSMRPTAPGVPGELWIGGAGVARGYLGGGHVGGDGPTAERFVQDPLGVLYRSGDLARVDPRTGDVTYLGRTDDQVKIRGVRVELAEVQAALEGHPGVAGSAIDVEVRASGPTEEERASRWQNVTHCVRCGLASNHPDAHLDADGVCSVCREFEGYRERTAEYFRPLDDLRALFDDARAARERAGGKDDEYDCIMLLSGGKDSTYALYRLVQMGLRVLVMSLDNGYISDSAKANIRRVVDHLGLELVFAETPAMNSIFADSLQRFSNVCQGCFKTIYTLATNLARERGISIVVTGLSRGQIFETRLADLYRAGIDDPDEIDRTIVEARKAYHRVDDAVARGLDVSAFANDDVFDEIRFVDFYRYCDEPLSEVLRFIADRAAWVRPEDTGRSTNCLINDIGIHVHKRTRGFHNYALPYSWDVRLGHKTRDECLDELDDEIDAERVERVLREVGFRLDDDATRTEEKRLVAYYVPTSEGDPPSRADLAAFLADSLPAAMVPSSFVPVEAIPLTAQGKVDRRALAGLAASTGAAREGVEPRNDTESALAEIWCEVLRLEAIGVEDDFVESGGDSILAIQVVSRARARGLALQPRDVFAHPTIAGLARVALEAAGNEGGRGDEDAAGPIAATPIQRWFLEAGHAEPERFVQSIVLRPSGSTRLSPAALEAALRALAGHHDALRLAVTRGSDGFEQRIEADASALGPFLETLDLDPDAAVEDLGRRLDPERGVVLRAALLPPRAGEQERLALVVHHLAIDAVSWDTLVTDLDAAYGDALEGRAPRIPRTGSTWAAWSRGLVRAAASEVVRAEADAWRALATDAVPTLPAGDSAVRGPGNRADERFAALALEAPDTQRLLDATSRSTGPGVEDLLIAALATAIARWAGSARAVQLDVEAHGRDAPAGEPSLDTTRTIGWFTALAPVRVRASLDPAATLAELREVRRRAPAGGQGYGLLAALSPDTGIRADLASIPASEVLFNYLGRAAEPGVGARHLSCASGLAVGWSPAATRTHALDVSAALTGGELRLRIGHDPATHGAATIEALCHGTLEALRELVTGGVGLTPADFPEADVSRADLDDILNEFGS